MGTTNGSSSTRKTEERELPVKLTEKELLARGDSMAECELAIETLKIERLQLNKRIKAQIDERETLKIERLQLNKRIKAQIDERGKLGHIIDKEAEDRTVKCEWRADFAKNVFRLVRTDTGEEVDTRAMTGTDRQGSLDVIEGGKDDDAETPPPRRPRGRPRKGSKPKSKSKYPDAVA